MNDFTQRNYKISGVFGCHIIQGQITRNEKPFKVYLGTEHGVVAWIEENNPFVSISVKETASGKDTTTEFANVIKLCGSRYNQPLRVSSYQ
jgi:hypothetical protein